jgi:MFS transporter, YNFM family, putative membrane transport protein
MSTTPADLATLAHASPRHPDAPLPPPLEAGSAAHRSAKWALFVGGFATFAMFYGPQPLLPLFAGAFRLDAAQASGVLSATAGAMALGLIPAGVLAQRFGPKPVMLAAIVLGALCSLLCALAPSFGALVALRALLGLVLAGLPAVASAWLAEEMDPRGLGRAVGLIIAGNAAGGMSSRLVCGVLGDLVDWRVAFAGLGGLGAIAAFEFWRSLPPSRRHRPRPLHPRLAASDLAGVVREPGLLPLFGLGLLLMGSFVSFYNYLGFRLVQAPFALSHSSIGAVFLLYVVGMFSSPWAGRQADRLGSARVLGWMLALCAAGLALTAASALAVIIVGVALFTFGFFGAHSVASSWVGRLARRSKALASAAYLTAYYLGASSMGWLGGHAWQAGAWTGVLVFLGVLWLGCVAIAVHLARPHGTRATRAQASAGADHA